MLRQMIAVQYGLVLVGGTLAVQVGAACLARVPLMQLYMYFADPHALPSMFVILHSTVEVALS